MEKEKGDGNTVLLTVIGVATLLVALVGATFAYFTTQINNDSQQSMSLGTAKPVGLTYTGKQFNMNNIIPGATSDDIADVGTFTVTNPAESSISQRYDLILKVDTNTLNNVDADGQLLLDITSTDATVGDFTDDPAVGGVSTSVTGRDNTTSITNGISFDLTHGETPTLPEGETSKGTKAVAPREYRIVNDQVIGVGDTDSYKMTLTFKELNIAQDHNQNQSFSAHIEIADVVSVNS